MTHIALNYFLMLVNMKDQMRRGKRCLDILSHRMKEDNHTAGSVWVVRNSERKRIPKCDLEKFLSLGYRKGRK